MKTRHVFFDNRTRYYFKMEGIQWEPMIKSSHLPCCGSVGSELQSLTLRIWHWTSKGTLQPKVFPILFSNVYASNKKDSDEVFRSATHKKNMCISVVNLFQLLHPPLCPDSLKHGLIETLTCINTRNCLVRQKSNSRWMIAAVTVEGFCCCAV